MCSSVKVLGSGSAGNCLVVYDSLGHYILVDVGLPIKKILSGVGHEIGMCDGVIVSHRHKDHSRSISDFVRLGIPVYANEDTCELYNGVFPIKSAFVGQLGGFNVQTFGVDHNAPNNAFIIDTRDGARILYITDARYVPCTARNVTFAVVECNYSDEDVMRNELEGELIKSQFDNHLSMSQCIDYLRAIKSDCLRGVLLWHLSNTNISPKYAKDTVSQSIGIDNIYLPKPNSQIFLN